MRDAWREVYLPRIQQGETSFAAKFLGAHGALLSVLAHFFEDQRWEMPMKTGLDEQSLSGEDQLDILAGGALPYGHARNDITGGMHLL